MHVISFIQSWDNFKTDDLILAEINNLLFTFHYANQCWLTSRVLIIFIIFFLHCFILSTLFSFYRGVYHSRFIFSFNYVLLFCDHSPPPSPSPTPSALAARQKMSFLPFKSRQRKTKNSFLSYLICFCLFSKSYLKWMLRACVVSVVVVVVYLGSCGFGFGFEQVARRSERASG